MAKYRIEHERQNCVGCAACITAAPGVWGIDSDGRARANGAKPSADGVEEAELDERELEACMLAARNCPVNIIHVYRKEGNEKLI